MMEFLNTISSNWEAIAAGAAIGLASSDKLAMVFISTIKNIRDAWQAAFPKEPTADKKIKIDWDE
jgi:hypothetical protein